MRLLPVIALVSLLFGCNVGLLHGLDEQQANEITAALERAGITADKSSDDDGAGRFRVLVRRGELAAAYAVLQAQALPRSNAAERAPSASAGLGETLFPSPAIEQMRLEATLAHDLERTLEGLRGVVLARVHLALAPVDPLRGDCTYPRRTAAVLLRATRQLTANENDVRHLIAGAVAGLQPTDVAVLFTDASEPAPPHLVSLGPLQLAPSSRATAAGLFATSAGLSLTLAIALAVTIRKLRRRERRAAQLE